MAVVYRMPNPISIVNTKPDGLAKANLILVRIRTKDKVVVACINKFILKNKFQYIKTILMCDN